MLVTDSIVAAVGAVIYLMKNVYIMPGLSLWLLSVLALSIVITGKLVWMLIARLGN